MLQALNALLRTVLLAVTAGLLAAGGWLGYQQFHKNDRELAERDAKLVEQRETIDSLTLDLAAKRRTVQRLEAALHLLKVDHRLAHLTVLQQGPAPGESTPDRPNLLTTVQFVEVDDAGNPLGESRQFTVRGDVVYVDAWVIKFGDQAVERGDPLRSTSICLFRRLFGEAQNPQEGFALDTVGSRPAAYSPGSEPSSLERELWANFWDYANNPDKARAAGVRAAHGEAPSIKVMPGKLYKLELRASGGLSIVTEELREPTPRSL